MSQIQKYIEVVETAAEISEKVESDDWISELHESLLQLKDRHIFKLYIPRSSVMMSFSKLKCWRTDLFQNCPTCPSNRF